MIITQKPTKLLIPESKIEELSREKELVTNEIIKSAEKIIDDILEHISDFLYSTNSTESRFPTIELINPHDKTSEFPSYDISEFYSKMYTDIFDKKFYDKFGVPNSFIDSNGVKRKSIFKVTRFNIRPIIESYGIFPLSGQTMREVKDYFEEDVRNFLHEVRTKSIIKKIEELVPLLIENAEESAKSGVNKSQVSIPVCMNDADLPTINEYIKNNISPHAYVEGKTLVLSF